MWYDSFVRLLLRSPLHSLASSGVMLITYTGRKSGRRYAVPVSYVQDGDTLLTTSFKNRTWWRSLRGGAPVTVRLRGRDAPAKATVVEDQAPVVEALRVYLRHLPDVARYFYVTLDDEGHPHPDELAAAAAKRVAIYTHLAE